jgi:formylglycine-generating enzyme required for sulfatase activity
MQELQNGTTLQEGKYRIEKMLGQGGFGITYKAVMKGSVTGSLGGMTVNIPVVLKEFFMDSVCLRVDGTRVSVPSTGSKEQTDRYRQKFIKEANNIASLSHPNIVQVMDVFEENGTVYYVMEYLEGGSLRQMMDKGALPEAQALEYIRQIGSALQYMHEEKHLCHLDVKPGNIMLTADGQAKLIDFGISKGYDKYGNETSSTPVGLSPGYAPLEQYQNALQDFSPVTDIYSLGATLLALLTGETPPEAAVVVNEDGIGECPSYVSPAVWQAINDAMEPKKKHRPQSMAKFLEMLDVQIDHERTVPTDGSGKEETKVVVEQQVAEETQVVNTPLTAPVEIVHVGNVSFKMIRVEGGTFTMGATSEQGWWSRFSDEKPTHNVTLSTYYIGETEVTQELWEEVMGSNPSKFKGSRHPVEMVSWEECQKFIRRLNQRTGLNFRLPTEAEWEYAARGGRKSRGYKYSGSSNPDDVAWYEENIGNTTLPVAQKHANELGLYDMSGNVWEWCQDWYGSYSSSSQTNPTGPSSGSTRVFRGGSWIDRAGCCRISFRDCNSSSSRRGSLGLRLAVACQEPGT